MFKKITALTMTAALCLSFASCGKKAEDSKKVTLAAKTSTMSAELTEQYAKEYGFDVVYYEDSPTMYQAVMNGTNAACFEDRSVIGWAIKEEGLKLKTVGEIENAAEYGFAVKKGQSADLLKMFNAGLARQAVSMTIYLKNTVTAIKHIKTTMQRERKAELNPQRNMLFIPTTLLHRSSSSTQRQTNMWALIWIFSPLLQKTRDLSTKLRTKVLTHLWVQFSPDRQTL